MERAIEHKLRVSKISQMKHPVIYMNSEDFEDLKHKLESSIADFKLSDTPKYRGVPIRVSPIIDRYCLVVLDDVWQSVGRD